MRRMIDPKTVEKYYNHYINLIQTSSSSKEVSIYFNIITSRKDKYTIFEEVFNALPDGYFGANGYIRPRNNNTQATFIYAITKTGVGNLSFKVMDYYIRQAEDKTVTFTSSTSTDSSNLIVKSDNVVEL